MKKFEGERRADANEIDDAIVIGAQKRAAAAETGHVLDYAAILESMNILTKALADCEKDPGRVGQLETTIEKILTEENDEERRLSPTLKNVGELYAGPDASSEKLSDDPQRKMDRVLHQAKALLERLAYEKEMTEYMINYHQVQKHPDGTSEELPN